MARPYRLQAENCLYHITSRGNDRKRIFSRDSDYKKFLEYLLENKDRYKYYVYAYVLMSNHYHLLIETTQPNLSRIMHSLNTAYTVYFNIKHKKTGHLFQGRYKSIIVDKQNYFMELTRYIHLNPVKAKIVECPEDYKWSSYRAYLQRKGDGYIDKDKIREYTELTPKEYKEFIKSSIGDKEDIYKDLYAGFILGGEKFIKETLNNLKGQLERGDIAYKRRINNNISIDDVVNLISKRYKVKKEDIYHSYKKPIREKKMALYLLKRMTGMTNVEIGEAFNISYSAVSKAYSSMSKEVEYNKKIEKEIKSFISHFKV